MLRYVTLRQVRSGYDTVGQVKSVCFRLVHVRSG